MSEAYPNKKKFKWMHQNVPNLETCIHLYILLTVMTGNGMEMEGFTSALEQPHFWYFIGLAKTKAK